MLLRIDEFNADIQTLAARAEQAEIRKLEREYAAAMAIAREEFDLRVHSAAAATRL